MQADIALLLDDAIVSGPAAALRERVHAFTVGGVRDVLQWHAFEGGFGAGVTVYGVPSALQSACAAHPVSFQV